MPLADAITLSRECEAIEIPSGARAKLHSGTVVRVMNSRGGSYTVAINTGKMFRIDAKDADALGLPVQAAVAPSAEPADFSEKLVWDQLKTVFDPEIPVNIVDLGLIYSCGVAKLERGGHKIDIKMSITAPGCGMANVLKTDVESKLSQLPDVREVHVEVVFDPPWSPGRMSEAAKLQLGLDGDYGAPSSTFSILR